MKRTSWRNTAFSRAPVVRIYNEYPDQITQPVKIALVTDLHSTRYGRRQEVLVRALRKYDPDLILLAGDIVDDQVPLVGTREFLAGIGMLPSPRCFYVTGNHEQRTGNLDAIKKMFTSHGVTVLSGETRTVNIRGQLLEIGGVDDPTVFAPNRFVRRIPRQWERQLADCRAGLAGERQLADCRDGLAGERYSILLTHRPELTRYYRESGFDLVVAGHAHGGQVRIPVLGRGLLAPHQGLFPRYAGGRYRLGRVTMIVSRGLCLNRLPRIFNPPELVMIHLLPD